jgi:hypothetical protein
MAATEARGHPQFLLELPQAVKNCDLKTNDWK